MSLDEADVVFSPATLVLQAEDLRAVSEKKSAHVDHKAIIDELKNSQAPAEVR